MHAHLSQLPSGGCESVRHCEVRYKEARSRSWNTLCTAASPSSMACMMAASLGSTGTCMHSVKSMNSHFTKLSCRVNGLSGPNSSAMICPLISASKEKQESLACCATWTCYSVSWHLLARQPTRTAQDDLTFLRLCAQLRVSEAKQQKPGLQGAHAVLPRCILDQLL